MIDTRTALTEYRYRCDTCGWQAPWRRDKEESLSDSFAHAVIGCDPR